MNQPVARDLSVDIWCAAALLCQRASHSFDWPVKRDGHHCHDRAWTKAEVSSARIAASPTCVQPNRLRRKWILSSTWRRVLNSCAEGCVWPTTDCERLSLLRKGITSCVQWIKSRLIGGRAVRAPTLERATFNVGSKPNGSCAIRAYIAGELLIFCFFCQQANSGHGQWGHRHRGQATNWAGQQQSRPKDTRPQMSY